MKKLTFIMTLFFACTEGPYVTDRDYPRMNPLQVERHSSLMADFTIEIYYSSVPILDHGFIYSRTGFPTMTNGTKISLGPFPGTGTSSKRVSDLESGEYKVRAYAVSDGHVVFSNTVTM
jgi:hypothetical protein